jgi:outer membrane protein
MKLQTAIFIGLVGLGGMAVAEDKSGMGDLLFAPQFQFQQSDSQNQVKARLYQYDATFSYPWHSEGISVGVGMNLRMIEGDIKSSLEPYQSINTTMPMFYASASFDLPLQGMQASVTGSHMDYEQWRAFDYRAKLSYQFDSSLGVQGGWQHQQLNLDAGLDSRSQFENKGPFVDFFWRF